MLQRQIKSAVMGWLAVCSIAVAHAGTASIQVYMTAVTANTGINQVSTQNVSTTEFTGLTIPTLYSVSSSETGGTSTDKTTVSLNTLHSYSNSVYPLDNTTSYSEGLINLTVDDFGVVPAGVTSLTNSLSLTGTTSLAENLSPYDVEATVAFDVYDLTKNTQTQAYFSLLSPGLDVPATSLGVNPGDQIELATTFDINTYQAGNSSVTPALLDYSDTLHLYVNTNSPGADFVDTSGVDYSTSAAGTTPEPGTPGLLVAGVLLLAAWRGRSKMQRPR
jgi:hypothetical protein